MGVTKGVTGGNNDRSPPVYVKSEYFYIRYEKKPRKVLVHSINVVYL